MSQEVSFDTFLDSDTRALTLPEQAALVFPDLGDVSFTTITRANLGLLRRAQSAGYAGILVSCPDFEREAIATAFLGALLHTLCDLGQMGLHEAEEGEKVAVGDCVVRITELDDKEVKYASFDQTMGIDKSIRAFPLVHRASPEVELSRTRSTKKRKYPSLVDAASEYEALPVPLKRMLDACGKQVPSVGYVASPSPYANEAPTRILDGSLVLSGNSYGLSDALPVTYLSAKGEERRGFRWPFDCPPSVLVGPRVDGVGSASQIVDWADEGHSIDFVSLNIPSLDLTNTSLLSDILDLKDRGIGVIAFCDRWTLSRLQLLVDNNFLPFDWGNCDTLSDAKDLILSPIQHRMMVRQQEKVLPVSDEDSGLSQAKKILYDNLDVSDVDDEALSALQNLFCVLGSAIRMTEAPDAEYSTYQRELIKESMGIIEASRIMNQREYDELWSACHILHRFFAPGCPTPKEQKIYDLITGFLDSDLPVVLVVDRNRTEDAYSYWCRELACNGYSAELFSVMTTRDYLGSNSLTGDENIIFSGWYDKGTMDRCLHSGIASNMMFVLYKHESGDLELEWWLKANRQWQRESDKCSQATDRTLAALGIKPPDRPTKSSFANIRPFVEVRKSPADESPSSVVTAIEKRRIQREIAHEGEKSAPAVPVMFHDGTHVWLKADPSHDRAGKLFVITGCLTGKDDMPCQKPPSALLSGDVVLRTHSDKRFIRRTSRRTTEGYDDVMAVAQRWKEPIHHAIARGYTDSDIVDRIYSRVAKTRTKAGVRGWVKGDRIAPQTRDDIEAIYRALGFPLTEGELDQIVDAVREIRNKHRAIGRMAAKDMVFNFLEDVRQYGLNDAIEGFDERHEAGDVELLRVTAVGERQNVAIDRVDVL